MPPWSPTLGRLLILLLHEVGVVSQLPKAPPSTPFGPTPLWSPTPTQSRTRERGARIPMARALGVHANGLGRPSGPPGLVGSGLGSPGGALGTGLG